MILDLVVNHTSDQHPWFLSARGDAHSTYRNWYVWSRRRPRDWNKGMVFPGSQNAIWTYDQTAGAYYRHRFYHHQPDLNTENPEVRAEILRIMDFWLQLGVDGFRLDALPFVIEPRRSRRKGRPHFEYVKQMRALLRERGARSILLAEANVPPALNCRYFGAGRHGVDMMFNFHVNQHLFCTLATEEARPLARALRATARIPSQSQWAMFLRNHDELDLGRLAKYESRIVFEKFAGDARMRLYERGIRRRLAPMLADRRAIELAYSALLSLPGTPVIRYGDEIGMGDDLSLDERDAVRTPMQWTSDLHGGFSTAQRIVRAAICDGPCGYPVVNVEAQSRDPASLLNWMRDMIRLRRSRAEIGLGRWKIARTGSSAVLGLCYLRRGARLLVLHNFSRESQSVTLSIPERANQEIAELRTGERVRVGRAGRCSMDLEGLEYRWYALERARRTARSPSRRAGARRRRESGSHF